MHLFKCRKIEKTLHESNGNIARVSKTLFNSGVNTHVSLVRPVRKPGQTFAHFRRSQRVAACFVRGGCRSKFVCV